MWQFHSILAQVESSNALVAVGLIIVGFVLGTIAAKVSRRFTGHASRPEVIRSSAGPIATLAFSLILIVSLIIALGLVNQTALDTLATDVALFLPRVISAAIVLIVANIVANFVETGISKSLGHVSPTLRNRVPAGAKAVIMGFAFVIAANQLGINTSIILIAVAAIFFTIGLSAALIAGFGGRSVAGEVAAGRAIRRDLKVGDTVKIGNLEGDVVAIGSTSTQITNSQRITLIPNSEILTQWVEVVQDAQTLGVADESEETDSLETDAEGAGQTETGQVD